MRRLPGSPNPPPIFIDLEGTAVPAIPGEPLACSMLAAGETVFSRSVKYHRPRGPYCFSAACSHCLMRVDGVPNVYTCRVPARAGTRVERQNAFPTANFDLLAATDWLFPGGLDHHEMFAGVPIAEKVMLKVARHLAGLGLLPNQIAATPPPVRDVKTQVIIVGAGPAGLAAARVLAAGGVEFALVERDPQLGGRLVGGIPSPEDPAVPEMSSLPKGAALLETTAIGLYEDERGRYVAAVHSGGVVRIYAERFLLAMGGHPQLLPFENNDWPGIYAGRAVSTLVRQHRVLPGENTLLVGRGEELDLLARLIADSGGKIAAVVDSEGRSPHPAMVHGVPERAHGRTQLSGLTVRLANGKKRRIDGDSMAICVPPAPSFELARQAGAHIRFDSTHQLFKVDADSSGRTAQRLVFVAGEVTGPMNAPAAARSGELAAQAMLADLGASR